MDLLPSVDALQDHLVAHDCAVRQIMMLDEYIETLSENRRDRTACPPLHHLIRLAVAEGIKRMYKEYRLRKWLQVQEMANVVRQVLSFAGDDVSNTALTVSQLAPTALPLLSPIITPHRLPGATTLHYYTPTVVSPGRHMTLHHPAGTNRELFPVETVDSEEVLECGEDMLDVSMGEEGRYMVPHEDTPDHSSTSVDPHSVVGHSVDSHVTDVISDRGVYSVQEHRQNTPVDQRQMAMVDQQLYEDISDDEDVSDDDEDSGMEWDEDEDVAGMLFAAEHLLPEQQSVRLDVEMGDNGVGHVIFDRISAVWYTAQSQFYRVD